MNAFFDFAPSGRFEARADTVGTDDGELAMLAEVACPTPEQAQRIATIRENMREALEALVGVQAEGQA